MKKIISVTLLVVLMLFTFAGCDEVEDILQKLPVPTNPTNPTNPADAARTTVTEEEWLAAMEFDNYTVDVVSTYGEQSATENMKLTESSRYHHNQQNGFVNEAYYAKIDNRTYFIKKEGDGFVAREISNVEVGVKLGDVYSAIDLREVYSSLVYDEEAKVYKYDYTDRNNQEFAFTFCFENGSIKTVNIIVTTPASVAVSYDVYDFGATAIELPEYTIAPNDGE